MVKLDQMIVYAQMKKERSEGLCSLKSLQEAEENIMQNTDQYQVIEMGKLNAGTIFTYSFASDEMYMLVSEDNGESIKFKIINIRNGSVRPYEPGTDGTLEVFVPPSCVIQFKDIDGNPMSHKEIHLDIIIEGMEQELERKIEILDMEISDAYEKLDEEDPKYYSKLKKLITDQHELYKIAKDIRPALNKGTTI